MISLDQIKQKKLARLSTGFKTLDVVLGGSDGEYGMVRGSLIITAASGGCGKTKLAIAISSYLNRAGQTILYVIGESSSQNLKKWTNGTIANPKKFLVSQDMNVDNICSNIIKAKPTFVVIDSVNSFDSSYGDAKQIVNKIAHAAAKTGSVIWMIGQLNAKSNKQDIRGSQDWVYLPDVVLHMKRQDMNKANILKNERKKVQMFIKQRTQDAGFKYKKTAQTLQAIEHGAKLRCDVVCSKIKDNIDISIQQKNRFGPSNVSCVVKHTKTSIEQVA